MTAAELGRLKRTLAGQLHAAGFIITVDLEVEAPGAAHIIGVAPKTLRNWRTEGMGPPSRTVRGVAWYSIPGLARWLLSEPRDGASLTTAQTVSQTPRS